MLTSMGVYYKYDYLAGAISEKGFNGKVWTKGFDKQFCFDEKELNRRINYVQKHNSFPPAEHGINKRFTGQ